MSNAVPSYPDAKSASSFEDGIAYQDFVCIALASKHLVLQNIGSKKFQYETGENLQGWEIKLDNLCTETGRLSIEIAEKSRAANANWVPSGIYRDDNSFLYIQGNYEVIFLFDKKVLRRVYETKKPKPHESYGTVRKFYIPIPNALKIAAKVFWLNDEERRRFKGAI